MSAMSGAERAMLRHIHETGAWLVGVDPHAWWQHHHVAKKLADRGLVLVLHNEDGSIGSVVPTRLMRATYARPQRIAEALAETRRNVRALLRGAS